MAFFSYTEVNLTVWGATCKTTYFDCLPLLPACLSVLCRVIQELIQHKRNMIYDEDDDSNTPLHIACIHGHTGVADVLLKSGSDPDAR